MILLELIGWIIIFFFFTFPLWIHGNYKTLFDKELKQYLKEEKKKLRQIKILRQIKYEKGEMKICTQYQPFKLDDKNYVVCNFICDGDCQFKGTTYYMEK